MCCETMGHSGGHHKGSMAIGICGCGTGLRHFLSDAEKKKMIEEYRDQLKSELIAVEEHLKELKNK